MDSIERYIERNLTEKRKRHIYGVRELAVRLALRHGADPEKAASAALFHDMFREISGEQCRELVLELELPCRYLGNPELAHGKIAAAVMERDYGISDPDTLNAVRFHTTGRPAMSLLEKIIFIADAAEPGRNYPSAEMLRLLSFADLDKAVAETLRRAAGYLEEKGRAPDPDTRGALEYYMKRIKKEKGMNSKELAFLAANTLNSKKASDIVMIDIEKKSSIADYFLLASGGSERQIKSLAEDLEDRLVKEGVPVKNIEGKAPSGWILMDFGDVIISVLTAEMRRKYDIEKVWADCRIIEWEEEKEHV